MPNLGVTAAIIDRGHILLALFEALPSGGRLQPNPSEVVEAHYFTPAELPNQLSWGDRQMIQDALHGVGGSIAWLQQMRWPFDRPMTRQELYALRDHSGLTRQQFYQQHFVYPGTEDGVLEVGG